MFYSVELYALSRQGTWIWMEYSTTDKLQAAKNQWKALIERGDSARVREVRDITSGNRWLD